MMLFKLHSAYQPAGDQPQAIEKLVFGLGKNMRRQTLLGVTGSGKTFTVANVIERVQMPTLVIAHNKTLAAQLCNEFREFFPNNAVEYFVSYYDYYQPEAYLPASDTYIEKEAMINEEIDRLRHACTQALLTRSDVIIVASVSAIYNLGSPQEYLNKVFQLVRGQKFDRCSLTSALVDMQFERTTTDLTRGKFRLRGQVFEVMPVQEEVIYRLEVSDKIERIEKLDAVTRRIKSEEEMIWLFPAKHYTASKGDTKQAFKEIYNDLELRLQEFESSGKVLEYERLKRRTRYDLEMIKNVGYCNGIENYSRYFDGRKVGDSPYTLLDYFAHAGEKLDETGNFSGAKRKFLTIIDESHVTIPQIRGMSAGDRARKEVLIEHGFRLPSARDNRPLNFAEFDARVAQCIFTSATPDDFELHDSAQVVEQIVRPTGLIDPEIVVRPIVAKKKDELSQVEDLLIRIDQRIKQNERVLVTTLTKKMAEDLSDYLRERKVKVKYLHSDVDTLDRIAIITALRRGEIDVIVGVNLLREGLDMPEVSLVAILDADKEGFLRNTTSLIQTIGRAARNVNGQVIIYADNITGSIQRAIEETDRRRKIQLAYNKKHGITPKTIEKSIKNILEEFGITARGSGKASKKLKGKSKTAAILEIEMQSDSRPVGEIIKDKERQMRQAAQELQFELASILRDEILELKKRKR
ncbi:MAG: excinuclease ABC subunit UvrB [Candidatus Magasanikbacteria bacterium]